MTSKQRNTSKAKKDTSFSLSQFGAMVCDELTKNRRGVLPGMCMEEAIWAQSTRSVTIPFPEDARKHSTNGGPKSYFCGKNQHHFTYRLRESAAIELERQLRTFNRFHGVSISREEYIEILFIYTYAKKHGKLPAAASVVQKITCETSMKQYQLLALWLTPQS